MPSEGGFRKKSYIAKEKAIEGNQPISNDPDTLLTLIVLSATSGLTQRQVINYLQDYHIEAHYKTCELTCFLNQIVFVRTNRQSVLLVDGKVKVAIKLCSSHARYIEE